MTTVIVDVIHVFEVVSFLKPLTYLGGDEACLYLREGCWLRNVDPPHIHGAIPRAAMTGESLNHGGLDKSNV